MKINKLDEKFVKLNSFGYEKNYGGTYIEYFDFTKTFLFFYYSNFLKIYIVDGKKKTSDLVQVEGKCNIILSFQDIYAYRFKYFYEKILTEEERSLIPFMDDNYFYRLKFCIFKKKNWRINAFILKYQLK